MIESIAYKEQMPKTMFLIESIACYYLFLFMAGAYGRKGIAMQAKIIAPFATLTVLLAVIMIGLGRV